MLDTVLYIAAMNHASRRGSLYTLSAGGCVNVEPLRTATAKRSLKPLIKPSLRLARAVADKTDGDDETRKSADAHEACLAWQGKDHKNGRKKGHAEAFTPFYTEEKGDNETGVDGTLMIGAWYTAKTSKTRDPAGMGDVNELGPRERDQRQFAFPHCNRLQPTREQKRKIERGSLFVLSSVRMRKHPKLQSDRSF